MWHCKQCGGNNFEKTYINAIVTFPLDENGEEIKEIVELTEEPCTTPVYTCCECGFESPRLYSTGKLDEIAIWIEDNNKESE